MDQIDRQLLDALQADLPLTEHPYRDVGKALALDEGEVLDRLRRLHADGLVRRIGPIINPAKLGRTGALVTANVPEERVEAVAAVVSASSAVSHNYLREPVDGTCPYNVWFTISAESEAALAETAKELAEAAGVELHVLPSRKKFKIGVRFALSGDNDG
ncbi:AsnC family transcriptional regulator [bacterium]|nr:AsnC family transcriptional regulator [bacterium]